MPRVDKTIRRYTSLNAMKAAEYSCWAKMPASARFQATAELTTEAYRAKGLIADVPRIDKTIVRITRPSFLPFELRQTQSSESLS